jgi:hypothetical protein
MTQAMMRNSRILMLLSALIGISGCSSGPAPQMKTIDAVEKTLDFSSISEIVCDYDHTPPPVFTNGVRFSRYIKLSGPEHVDALIADLESHGFALDEGGKGLLFTDLMGPHDVRATIDVIAPPDDRIGTTFDNNANETCLIPEEGVTGLRLSLPS